MKKTYLVLFAFVPVLIFTSTVFAFRCGPDNKYIAHEGMHKYQILKDCGQPLSRETVGANYGGGWYRYVEEWVYIENSNKGMLLDE